MSQKIDIRFRETHPPVLIVQCPGGGGHFWARLNTYFTEGKRINLADKYWCDDHQREKRSVVLESLRESSIRTAREYAKLPLPSTKRCNNPDPVAHPVGAVLPSGSFYRRWGKGANKHVEQLDSRCKDCRREESRIGREKRLEEDRESFNAARRDWYVRNRVKAKKGRARLKKESDKEMPVGPFRSWLKRAMAQNDMTKEEIAAGSGVTVRTLFRVLEEEEKVSVRLSTIDAVGICLGHPGLVEYLYPADEGRAA